MIARFSSLCLPYLLNWKQILLTRCATLVRFLSLNIRKLPILIPGLAILLCLQINIKALLRNHKRLRWQTSRHIFTIRDPPRIHPIRNHRNRLIMDMKLSISVSTKISTLNPCLSPLILPSVLPSRLHPLLFLRLLRLTAQFEGITKNKVVNMHKFCNNLRGRVMDAGSRPPNI
jgi:hypothetical protein